MGGMMKSRILLVLIAPLLLTGCLISPGKFASQLELMKDGSFSYSYAGEIQMIAFSKLADMAAKEEEEFTAEDCYDDDFNDRPCTEDEIAEQKAEWDANAESRIAKKAKEAEQMKLLLGGIDPTSPEAAEEFATKLARQKGWSKVVHRGDGLFDVEFAIAGQLSHDFIFPMIEKMPMTGSGFVSAILRNDGKVRIDADGFAAQGAGNPMQGMMSGAMGLAQLSKSDDGETPNLVLPEGKFTIVTDGAILANNTDEGPSRDAKGRQVLVWDISPRTEAAPTALIDLSN